MCYRDDEEDKPLYGTAARARWDEDAAEAPNGRGIHLATRDFDHRIFKGSGNRVECVKRV